MDKVEKIIVMGYLNEAFDALDNIETRKVQDHISEVMEIVEDEDSIPISWIKSYLLYNNKPFLLFNDMINEWRRYNGKQ